MGGGGGGLEGADGMGGGGGVKGADGMGGGGGVGGEADWAVAKLKPHDSQNWPILAVPHTGHDWSGPAACEPLPEEELAAAPADEGGDEGGGGDPGDDDPG
jgi:hypothetical protein